MLRIVFPNVLASFALVLRNATGILVEKQIVLVDKEHIIWMCLSCHFSPLFGSSP